MLFSALEGIASEASDRGKGRKQKDREQWVQPKNRGNYRGWGGGCNNNLIAGDGGNDHLKGNGGKDVLLGHGGDDILIGNGREDLLKGGSGNDRVFGRGGNDHLIYQLADNVGESTFDFYDGGGGKDTLWLNLTAGEYATYKETTIAEIQSFFTKQNKCRKGQRSATFAFTEPITRKTSKLKITNIEQVEILRYNNFTAAIGNTSGSVTEDDDPDQNGFLKTQGTLTITDEDHLDAQFIPTTQTGTYGQFTVLDGQGNWTYSADNNQTAIQALNTGDTLSETFTITSMDGTTADFAIEINGVNE
ncbi:MAG: hypothetical protein HC796_10770, partial [Synechococcaceae cyanobacterium RL_1_2]|nr:hypothetical protein [Synechococcaceae cyanobacterium RL_1_2]